MDMIDRVLENVTSTLTGSNDSPEQGINCPICSRFVPKIQIEVLGHTKLVQPSCKCQWERHQAEIAEAEERLRQDKIRQLFPLAKMGERFQGSTFANYRLLLGNEEAYTIAQKYAAKFDQRRETSLYIWGEPGNGKSHLAAAITHELMTNGKTVVFQTVPELLNRIRKTFKESSKETETQIMNALMRCHLLVLDDIGSEKVTDWVGEALLRIIDGRYQEKKPILFTSNLSLAQLADRFDDIQGIRIADRLSEMTVQVHNLASSYRLEVAEKRMNNVKRREWYD